MTTIRPAVAGARPREVLTLYYPLLPRQPRICNHQLSRRPPRPWPPSAIPGSTLHSRASHVSRSALPSRPDLGGIHHSPDAAQAGAARQQLEDFLVRSRLRDITICTDLNGAAPGCRASLAPAFAAQHLPDHDTTGLARSLGLDSGADEAALEREILLAMLGSPVPPFPSVPELESAVRIRRRIVQAARKTALAFDTEHAERGGYWTYDEERGFTILPGRSLIEGLRRATQPGPRASSTPSPATARRVRHGAGHRPGA